MVKTIECSFAASTAPVELVEEANRLGLSGFKIIRHSVHTDKEGFVHAIFIVENLFDVNLKIGTVPEGSKGIFGSSGTEVKTKMKGSTGGVDIK